MKKLINKLKRALLSVGFVLNVNLGNPRAAEKLLIALTQDQFEIENEQERKQWESWHPLERSFCRPDWVGKPRPTLKALMRQNLNKEALRRMEKNNV